MCDSSTQFFIGDSFLRCNTQLLSSRWEEKQVYFISQIERFSLRLLRGQKMKGGSVKKEKYLKNKSMVALRGQPSAISLLREILSYIYEKKNT